MNRFLTIFLVATVLLFSCKKTMPLSGTQVIQLYPLRAGNVWIYEDSFFTVSGAYYGKDTFRLKPGNAIRFNNQEYTPITDQYDDSIFTIRSDDTTVYMLEPQGESLIYTQPLPGSQPVINHYYDGNILSSAIFTERSTTTNYPAYKIVITQDDGYWLDYRQQQIYFSPGLGIIKGSDTWKANNGNLYTSDIYQLLAYSLN